MCACTHGTRHGRDVTRSTCSGQAMPARVGSGGTVGSVSTRRRVRSCWLEWRREDRRSLAHVRAVRPSASRGHDAHGAAHGAAMARKPGGGGELYCGYK